MGPMPDFMHEIVEGARTVSKSGRENRALNELVSTMRAGGGCCDVGSAAVEAVAMSHGRRMCEIQTLCENELRRRPCWGRDGKRLFTLKRILDLVEVR